MAIYVDSLRVNGFVFYNKTIKSCHMITDGNIEELHKMALKIGIKLEWIDGKLIPHFDITKRKRDLAVKYGAIELGDREFSRKVAEIKVRELHGKNNH